MPIHASRPKWATGLASPLEQAWPGGERTQHSLDRSAKTMTTLRPCHVLSMRPAGSTSQALSPVTGTATSATAACLGWLSIEPSPTSVGRYGAIRHAADSRVRARYDPAVMTLIRALLIWLLVLAVPAQGAAAATMAFCGSSHHGAGASGQVLPAEPAQHAHHGGMPGTAHQHPELAALADGHSSLVTPSAASTDAGGAVHQKCSACASCCSVSAILSSVLAVPAPLFTPTVFSAVVPTVDTLAADGPDRPPRIVLA